MYGAREVRGAEQVALEYDSAKLYAALLERSRLAEGRPQMRAIREGLTTIVPRDVLTLLTWEELRRAVCLDERDTARKLDQWQWAAAWSGE